jgi:hypothetical protein
VVAEGGAEQGWGGWVYGDGWRGRCCQGDQSSWQTGSCNCAQHSCYRGPSTDQLAACLPACPSTQLASSSCSCCNRPPPLRRRYYIGCDKLASLGWTEKTQWQDGLKKTIDWYLSTQCSDYWEGDLELALRPHPVVHQSNLMANSMKPGNL